MKVIKRYVREIDDELHGAENYAEKYLEYKADNKIDRANKYQEMAEDELKHANYIHGIAIEEINKLSKVYTPPLDMTEKWSAMHQEYVDVTDYVKRLLEL